MRASAVLLGLSLGACALRGHVATPDEIARLRLAEGLSASGRITLSSPRGRFSARVVFGVARPDSLRIEIPDGSGLRFLLLSRNGTLRADFPEDDAMFMGPSTSEVMNGLFGIELNPKDLVEALLGSAPESMNSRWRFEGTLPIQVTLRGVNESTLDLRIDDPRLESPSSQAFEFGPPRGHLWTLLEMSGRLGLRR